MKQVKETLKAYPREKAVQLCCLLVIAVIEGLTMLFGSVMSQNLQYYAAGMVNGAAVLFLGTVLREISGSKTAKKLFLLGLGFCIWTLLLQLHEIFGFGLEENFDLKYGKTTFFCEYMVLLPMAALLDDQGKDRSLLLYSFSFLAAVFGYMILTAVIYLGGGGALRKFAYIWYESRLSVMWNPNILGGILLMGLGFTLILFFRVKNLWLKSGLILFGIVEFFMITLTNCRTAIIMLSCIFGGVVFFLIYKGSAKRFLLGAVAALLVLSLTYKTTSVLFSARVEYMLDHVSTMEQIERTEQEQKRADMGIADAKNRVSSDRLQRDFWNFNGRSDIWKGAFLALKAHPSALLTGSRNVGEFMYDYNDFHAAHAHNSWIQTLVGSGLIGFLLVLYLTWLAVKNSFLLCFMKESAMYQKAAALTVIGVMGSQFFEPYLFHTEFPCNFIQIPFMLCLGYVIYWVSILPERKKIRKSESI